MKKTRKIKELLMYSIEVVKIFKEKTSRVKMLKAMKLNTWVREELKMRMKMLKAMKLNTCVREELKMKASTINAENERRFLHWSNTYEET